MSQETAIIIGAGPAGLTAAFELLARTKIKPIVLEQSDAMGGIAQTVNYKGNRIDIGGHRFFSKSDWVMQWWLDRMPLQGAPARDERGQEGADRPEKPESLWAEDGPDPEGTDLVMLVRRRLSRIYCFGKLLDYPLSLSLATLQSLGMGRMVRIMFSYLHACLRPIRPEKNLEDFIINRFGTELYRSFFESYTEKVWGVPCSEIPPHWGGQRIKGVSIRKALASAIKRCLPSRDSIEQKEMETSLIEWFLYPKLGPGQLWEETARIVSDTGGEVRTHEQVVGVRHEGPQVTEVTARHTVTGEVTTYQGDYFFSTMPVQGLIGAMGEQVPGEVAEVAEGLTYRSHITVGVLARKMKLEDRSTSRPGNLKIRDNWIYVQEADVKLGRIQVLNNWSPYLVNDPDTVWLGLEYFADEGDELWSKPDEETVQLAVKELAHINIIEPDDLLDSVVVHTPKAYPGYFGSYDRFDVIREYVDRFENLFLIGRNGMHRYNNQDHSMLTALKAVENIIAGVSTKENIWSVNIEQEYHEEKSGK